MSFLIDAQLPPSLAEALRGAGLSAIHVADIGLLTATDNQIWNEAISRSAVLVTKDRDFPILRTSQRNGPVILWIRIGNADNRTLIARIIRALPRVTEALERGETIIELVGC